MMKIYRENNKVSLLGINAKELNIKDSDSIVKYLSIKNDSTTQLLLLAP